MLLNKKFDGRENRVLCWNPRGKENSWKVLLAIFSDLLGFLYSEPIFINAPFSAGIWFLYYFLFCDLLFLSSSFFYIKNSNMVVGFQVHRVLLCCISNFIFGLKVLVECRGRILKVGIAYYLLNIDTYNTHSCSLYFYC